MAIRRANEAEKAPDLFVLRHVATIAALEIEKVLAERERKRRTGAELLAALIDNRIDADTATRSLAERGLAEEPRIVAGCANVPPLEHSNIHLHLDDRAVPHLVVQRGDVLLALLPATPESLTALRGAPVLVRVPGNVAQIMAETLNEREREVLARRFGLGGGAPATQPDARHPTPAGTHGAGRLRWRGHR